MADVAGMIGATRWPNARIISTHVRITCAARGLPSAVLMDVQGASVS